MANVVEPETPPKIQVPKSGKIFVGGQFVDIGSLSTSSNNATTSKTPSSKTENLSVGHAPDTNNRLPASLQMPEIMNDKVEKSNDDVKTSASKWKQSPVKPRRRPSAFETFPKESAASQTSQIIIENLKNLYKSKVLPIEKEYNLYNFCLPTNAEIQDSEFDAKPMVLLLGQYSTGKTTFIRYLVGGDFPAMHIGPEPTTDRFMALINGDENDPKGRVVKGNSLTVMPELPFSTLSKFGSGFLSHFVGSITSAPLLEHVTLIDTPGVLSGEKQRISRSYDFSKAARWFADRSDLILFLFDAHKLDISDELKDVIEVVRPHNDDKIRCVLNKSDAVTREQLVRVYGSLLWNMGKIFSSPEVIRVYTGSYWDEQPLVNDDFEAMFSEDENLLIDELIDLPRSCAERKLNELVKRIRIIKVHVCVLSYLKKQMPRWFGKQKAQKRLLDKLEHIFDVVRLQYDLSRGDFPEVSAFAKSLEDQDFSQFPIADRQIIQTLDDLILKDIPNIVKGTNGVTGSQFLKDQSKNIIISDEKAEDEVDPVKATKQRSSFLSLILFLIKTVFLLLVLYCISILVVTLDENNFLNLPEEVLHHLNRSFQLVKYYFYDPTNHFSKMRHVISEMMHQVDTVVENPVSEASLIEDVQEAVVEMS